MEWRSKIVTQEVSLFAFLVLKMKMQNNPTMLVAHECQCDVSMAWFWSVLTLGCWEKARPMPPIGVLLPTPWEWLGITTATCTESSGVGLAKEALRLSWEPQWLAWPPVLPSLVWILLAAKLRKKKTQTNKQTMELNSRPGQTDTPQHSLPNHTLRIRHRVVCCQGIQGSSSTWEEPTNMAY